MGQGLRGPRGEPYVLDGQVLVGTMLQAVEARALRWAGRWSSAADFNEEKQRVASLLREAICEYPRPPSHHRPRPSAGRVGPPDQEVCGVMRLGCRRLQEAPRASLG